MCTKPTLVSYTRSRLSVRALVALAHGVLALHTGLLAILGRLLLAVLGALTLAVFRAGLAGGSAVILIHDYHLTVSSMPPLPFLYTAGKKFFKEVHTRPLLCYNFKNLIITQERMIHP